MTVVPLFIGMDLSHVLSVGGAFVYGNLKSYLSFRTDEITAPFELEYKDTYRPIP